jgi:hypothetical protein
MDADLKDTLVDAFADFVDADATTTTVVPYQPADDARNELLFFVKPEVTTSGPDTLRGVLDVVGDAFDRYDVSVTGAKILGADYLDEHNLISRHYGVINEIARNGVDAISHEAKETFEELYGQSADDAPLYGAFQFLDAYPFFSETALNVLWDNVSADRLASGTYCAPVRVMDDEAYLLNGFHPHQIAHYTQDGASIVACTVQSDTDWDVLRETMTGATDPEEAAEGSIRQTLLARQEELGLPSVDQGNNGVHLSAGALEGLAETIRFFSDHDRGATLGVDETAAGRAFLDAGLDADTVHALLDNPDLEVDGRPVSAFDLTEEINTDAAIERLKSQPASLPA